MKPTFLFMCGVPDTEARGRMTRFIDIVELDSPNTESILTNIEGKEGLIVPFTPYKLVTQEVIDRGTALKLIGTTYGGTRKNVEDEYAVKKGLLVLHAGAARARPVAEYTLALILSSLLQIHNYHHAMRSGEIWPWDKFGRTRILDGRKVGIIGVGRIGSMIIELLRPFTSAISIRSNHISESEARDLKVEKLTLDEVFEECEVVILSGGYTKDTHHMIGREQFEKMKDGALFVNIAQGGMVDEEAMLRAVTELNIFLALDVFSEEPLPIESPFRKNDRILITPHRANNPIEFERRWQVLADEIERYYTGGIPESALTLERAHTMSEV